MDAECFEPCTSSEDSLRDCYGKIIDGLFDRCYDLKKQDKSTANLSCEMALEKLSELEADLNSLKSRIPSEELHEWRRHTALTNPSREVPSFLSRSFELQYCTQAFCKFFEILVRFPSLVADASSDDRRFRTLHLCEAPGAFISALNVYLHLNQAATPTNWRWFANSLNPHYEWTAPCDMFLDDELITKTSPHWLFGADNSGDVLRWDKDYLAEIEESIGKFDLITADGSIYCQDDPSKQELATFRLIKAETEISLNLLAEGGSYVMKLYTMFRPETVELIANLICVFDNLHIIKPSCSKSGNSEVYLVGENYRRETKSAFRNELAFQSILSCAQFFASSQKGMVEFNLMSFCARSEPFLKELLFTKQSAVVRDYCLRMKTEMFGDIDKAVWLGSWNDLVSRSPSAVNPWKFKEQHGQVESLREISLLQAKTHIDQMVLNAFMSGVYDSLERTFYVECCRDCENCQWFHRSAEALKEAAEPFVFGSPTTDSLNIKQTLFADLESITFMNVAKVAFSDLSELGHSVGVHGVVASVCESAVADTASSVNLVTQHDWIALLLMLSENDARVADIQVDIIGSLILSRFTASVFAILTLVFEKVVLETKANSAIIIQCSSRNAHLGVYRTVLRDYLHRLQDSTINMGRGKSTSSCQRILQFVPLCHFRCEKFYLSVREYNSFALLRILAQVSR